MIEITISKEGEVKIKVDNQAQSVSISGPNSGVTYDPGVKESTTHPDNVIYGYPFNSPKPVFAPDLTEEEKIIIKTDGECRASIKSGFAEFQQEVNEGIKKGDVKVNQIIPSEDCKRQNICGYEPQLKSGQLKYDPKNRLTEISPKTMDKIFGCKSGEIEGGPTY